MGPQSVQPLLYGVGHFRPCFPKSHHSWLQSCPVPMEDEGGGSLRIGRVCREPCRHSVSPNSSLRARGPNSEPHPPCILGEDRALLVSFPLRSPGTAPMKCRHPCLPLPLPRPGESRGKAEGWRGVPKPLPLQPLPHFPDFALATGAPHPPSWLLGPPCSLSAAGLPSCLHVVGDCRWWSWLPESTGEIWSQPHCRAWGRSQPISFHCL